MPAPYGGYFFGAWPNLPGAGGGEIAFGVDWPPDADGTDDHGNTVDPSGTTSRDIDCSGVPNNAAAVIRFSLIWFQLTGAGAVQLFYNAVLLAFRDSNGDLHADLTWTNAEVVTTGSVLFDITSVTTPDNNTVRVTLTNQNAESAQVFWRWVISSVSAGNPVPPP